jgi:CheY-like chemotaxis protein
MAQRSYLIVDDNPAFLENLHEILTEDDAEVHMAASGAEALALVAEHRFDAIVTDMRMPGMSGAELLHQLRTVDARVPVILLSAYAADTQLRDARRDGLLAVLSKPSQIPRLLELLSRARRGGNIVLVEDDVALADNLTEAFNNLGLTVCTARDLQEIDKIGVEPFAALVDLRLPGGPVGQSVRLVHERFPLARTVVITAFADQAHDYDELYTKPFDTGALVQRIEHLYAQGRASAPRP